MRSRLPRILPLVCGSGLCALIYEVGWERELRLIFGATTAASSAVVAVFVGGLGLGALLVGRRAERHPAPLLLYARLEALVALYAALTPLLFVAVRGAYLRLGGSVALGATGGTAARLALAALVLVPPTLLMGGTLPAAARAAQGEDDPGRHAVGLLYGLNTLGAVAGALTATFVLLERLGTAGTLWCASAVNLGVALAAALLGRRAPATATRPAPGELPAAGAAGPRAAAPARLVLGAAAVVGAVFFLMEMVWYRVLAPLLGGSIFTFGLILAVALLGIGLGGALYGALGRDRRATLSALALTCLVEALALAVPYALGDRLAVVALLLRPAAPTSLWSFALGWLDVTAIVVLPAAIVAGLQFPLLIALLGEGRPEVARQVGLAYAWNTAGAVTGAVAGGFGLMARLGALGCWRLGAALLVLVGLGLAAVAARDRPARGGRTRALGLPLAVGAATLGLLLATGPTAVWRHGAIGAGRVPPAVAASPAARRDWESAQRRTIIWEREGTESSLALSTESGLAFLVNGKVDGNARHDAATQVMGPLLGALLHGDPRRALVIGLGTGSSAGWLGADPAIERVDVVELEPAIVEVARACAAVNRDVLTNPRVHLVLGDAREVLLTTRARYDVVFSEPSNPYRAGVASLFTREFYEAVRRRLAAGGLFLQWVQGYEIDAATLASVYATLGRVFPSVETWVLRDNDLLLVAGDAERPHDLARLAARARAEPYRGALARVWRVTDLEGVFGHFLGPPALARLVGAAGRAAVNTDDRSVIEFGFARMLGRGGDAVATLRRTAAAAGLDQPEVTGGRLDAARLARQHATIQLESTREPLTPRGAPPDERLRLEALRRYVADDLRAAGRAWDRSGSAPTNGFELAVAAEVAADAAAPSAPARIAALAAFSPIEAQAARARLLLRGGDAAGAGAELAAAFEAYRRDPWPWGTAMRHALQLVEEIARREPATAPRLFAALGEPFAVYGVDLARLRARLTLASFRPPGPPCLEALRPFEPHVQWEGQFLDFRRRCYALTGDRRAARAAADLAEWQAMRGPGDR